MKVTYVNEENIKKSNFTLRKIAVMLALASTIMLTGCGKSQDLEDIRDKYLTGDRYDYDENEQLTIHDLMHYEQAYGAYQNDKSIENRVELVKQTKKLGDVANRFITRKLNMAMGTDYNITGEHSGTEEVLYADGELLNVKFPNEIETIIRNKRFIDDDTYKGDGSSNVWDKEIDNFNDKGKTLYSLILKNLDVDYEFDDNKIKVSKVDTSQNVR